MTTNETAGNGVNDEVAGDPWVEFFVALLLKRFDHNERLTVEDSSVLCSVINLMKSAPWTCIQIEELVRRLPQLVTQAPERGSIAFSLGQLLDELSPSSAGAVESLD